MTTLSVRIPDSLHKAMKELAAKDGYSMNQFLVTAAAEKLSALDTLDYITERARKADLKEFDRILNAIPEVPVDETDRIPR